MDRDEVEVHKNTKMNVANIQPQAHTLLLQKSWRWSLIIHHIHIPLPYTRNYAYLTIILRNRAEYRLILKGYSRHSARLSGIIVFSIIQTLLQNTVLWQKS